jgi:hypothetical protein
MYEMSDPGQPGQPGRSGKEVICVECGNPFPVSDADRSNHVARGYANDRMRCPTCSAAQTGTHTGPVRRQFRWEYRDLTIPLGLTTRGRAHHAAAVRFDQIVGASIRGVGREGWQADGPTDWWSLWADGRVTSSWRQGFFAALIGGRGVWTYESVTVRLKRVAA